MSLTPGERVLRSKMAVHKSWANTEDRTARKAFYAEMAFKSHRSRRKAKARKDVA